jgi:hypothetical protein
MLSGLKRPLPVLNDPDYPRPRVSADGTTLFMAAARLDEITQHFSLLGFVDKPERMMIDGVNWISRVIPRVYLPTRKPGLKTLVNVAVSKYRMKREPVGATFEPFLYFMFCQLLDSWLQGQISNEKNAWFPFAFLHAAQVLEWLPFFGVDKAESSNAKQPETAYTELRKSHPDAPWPEHVDKPLATKGGDSNSEQHPGFAHHLAKMIKELMGLKHSAHKPPAESSDGIKENVLFDLMKHCCEALNMQSIFVTK